MQLYSQPVGVCKKFPGLCTFVIINRLAKMSLEQIIQFLLQNYCVVFNDDECNVIKYNFFLSINYRPCLLLRKSTGGNLMIFCYNFSKKEKKS